MMHLPDVSDLLSMPVPQTVQEHFAVIRLTLFQCWQALGDGKVVKHATLIALTQACLTRLEALEAQERLSLCLGGVQTIRVHRFSRKPQAEELLIHVPSGYLDMARADVLFAFSESVRCASLCLDTLEHCEGEPAALATDLMRRRAKAWQAECLLALRATYAQHGLPWTPSLWVERLLTRLPKGLASLPKHLRPSSSASRVARE
ncbi:hypothetical protein KSF_087150 [Reticulibacter mediterranei]|uniref:Uncharacterized protein n=1 Tax=Reticulibacter mediterranei TaxID=2778369 RepID=A0A8J3IXM4_9CHLR|nr:hypothetical protein [Reticulibacter mediterranei]GHO98667.1 hypothetical protein KSF_087150 [Reticulibacter mediterranei]